MRWCQLCLCLIIGLSTLSSKASDPEPTRQLASAAPACVATLEQLIASDQLEAGATEASPGHALTLRIQCPQLKGHSVPIVIDGALKIRDPSGEGNDAFSFESQVRASGCEANRRCTYSAKGDNHTGKVPFQVVGSTIVDEKGRAIVKLFVPVCLRDQKTALCRLTKHTSISLYRPGTLFGCAQEGELDKHQLVEGDPLQLRVRCPGLVPNASASIKISGELRVWAGSAREFRFDKPRSVTLRLNDCSSVASCTSVGNWNGNTRLRYTYSFEDRRHLTVNKDGTIALSMTLLKCGWTDGTTCNFLSPPKVKILPLE
jgi:hypothetical protein